MSDTSSPIITLADQTPYQRWKIEISYANQEVKKFHERAQKVVKKFIDERDATDASAKWFNLFYANCSILESALYAQLPKPTVSRKYLDYQDDVARVAAIIIERCITQDLDDPDDHFDSCLRSCVQDRLVPGLSQAWLRLETDTEDIKDVVVPPVAGMEEAEDAQEGETGEQEPQIPQRITTQRVVIDYIFWKDFLWSPCRVWDERRWVARKAYMSREELNKRFGKEIGSQIPLNHKTNTNTLLSGGISSSTPTHMAFSTACIHEIWDRTTRRVVWFSEDYPEILDDVEDPLGLIGFEPCPEPMLANTSTSNTVPRPDYYMIQDQYQELDTLNNRLALLIQACKVVGVYDKSAVGIQRMLNEGFDNQLIPVDSWAMFAEKNGLKGQIDWMPLEAVVQAIQQLNAAREVIKGQIYELTGIADIVRGASKASETLGAQQIKAQFASIRIKKLQDEVARFASDIMRIKAEIMVKHFTPELLIQKSNILQTDNKELVGPALAMLKSEEGFEWRIQITADTLAQADYAMEKADRIAFLTSISGYLQQAGGMVQAVPESASVLVGILKWAIAGFRNARDIEGMLDKALDAMQKQPEQDKGPSPEEQKIQAELQQLQIEMKAAQEKHQMEMQALQAKTAADQQSSQAELQIKQQTAALEFQAQQMQLQFEQQKLLMEQRAEEQKLALEAQAQRMELMFQKMMQEIKLQGAQDLNATKQKAAKEAKADA